MSILNSPGLLPEYKCKHGHKITYDIVYTYKHSMTWGGFLDGHLCCGQCKNNFSGKCDNACNGKCILPTPYLVKVSICSLCTVKDINPLLDLDWANEGVSKRLVT